MDTSLDYSVLRMISVGLVAEMKPRNARQLNVIAAEITSALDGEARFNPKSETIDAKDANGDPYQVRATTDASVVAEWLPYDDNRATPPDVVRGELVELWRNANTDQYFWRAMNLRQGLRSLESIIWLVGATRDVQGHQMDLSKCYIFQISGHDRHVTLSTSKVNGEKYAYKLQLNGGAGQAFLKDDIDQFFLIRSEEHLVHVRNADASEFKAERMGIDINAEEYIQLKVGGTIIRLDPTSIKETTTTHSVTATTASLKATTYSVVAPTISFTCASFDFL